MTNPNHSMRISGRGLALIKQWEGFVEETYIDLAGKPTIGWGITDPRYAFPGNKITREQAHELLIQHVAQDEIVCRDLIKVKLSQPQWDAIMSLCYNIGTTQFATSAMLRKINRSDFAGAYAEFPKWRKSGGKVVQGLINRRKDEADLFLSGTTFTRENSVDAEELVANKPTGPSSNLVPDPTPNTEQSNKKAGAALTAGGAALTQTAQLEAVKEGLAPVAHLNEWLSLLFVGVTLLGIYFMLKKSD